MSLDPVAMSMLASSLAILVDWLRPGAHAFSQRVGTAFGAVMADGIYQTFSRRISPSASVADSTSEAKALLRDSQSPHVTQLLGKVKRDTVRYLRDSYLVDRMELEVYWQDFGRPEESFGNMWQRVGNTQAGAADAIVTAAIQGGTLPDLLRTMRQQHESRG